MRQGELNATESCTPYAPRAMYRCGSYTSSRNLRSPSNATHGRVLGTGMPFQMMAFHSWRESAQAEHCRQKAIECEQEADRAKSPVTAEAWLKLAKQWRELADKLSVIVLALGRRFGYCAGGARFKNGVLTVRLPEPEAIKPEKKTRSKLAK
jgi:hypothetical protein